MKIKIKNKTTQHIIKTERLNEAENGEPECKFLPSTRESWHTSGFGRQSYFIPPCVKYVIYIGQTSPLLCM